MSKQHLFVSNRDVMLNSTLGHAIFFKKGEPTHVPPRLHKEAIEKGILPVEGVEAATAVLEEAEAGPKIVLAPEDPEARKEAIGEALKKIAKRNNAADFTGGGTPNAQAVTAALGWRVDQREIKEVWVEIRKNIS